MTEKLPTHQPPVNQFLKNFRPQDATEIFRLRDEQSVTAKKLRLQKQENPNSSLIEIHKKNLANTLTAILRYRVSFEQEKSTKAEKEKAILEAKLKSLQGNSKSESIETIETKSSFKINPPSEIIYELNKQNYLVFLRECFEDVDPREQKSESAKFFNLLIGEMKVEYSESKVNIHKLKNSQELNLVLVYLYNFMNSNKEILKIKGVGKTGAAHIQKGLELFFQRINYQPEEK